LSLALLLVDALGAGLMLELTVFVYWSTNFFTLQA